MSELPKFVRHVMNRIFGYIALLVGALILALCSRADAQTTYYETTVVVRTDYNAMQSLDGVRLQSFGYVKVARGVWRAWIPAYDKNDQIVAPILSEIYDYRDRFDITNDGTSNIADLVRTVDFMFRGAVFFKGGL